MLQEFAPHRCQNAAVSTYGIKIEAAVVGPYWRNLGVYENVKYADEKHISHFT